MTGVKLPILTQANFKLPIEYTDNCNNSVATLNTLFEIQPKRKRKTSLEKQEDKACKTVKRQISGN